MSKNIKMLAKIVSLKFIALPLLSMNPKSNEENYSRPRKYEKWTREESAVLNRCLEAIGEEERIDWQYIASEIGSRDTRQCFDRCVYLKKQKEAS